MDAEQRKLQKNIDFYLRWGREVHFLLAILTDAGTAKEVRGHIANFVHQEILLGASLSDIGELLPYLSCDLDYAQLILSDDKEEETND